ncbi:MAG TPA: SRPBCC domain-containing protein [Candidatus Limnocylindria bacterium]|jgi:carbon monoxide dehydrogenase subunit G|nr:SRPBCC domain-containing protein [Candidatus Limnocylindria bacterium]
MFAEFGRTIRLDAPPGAVWDAVRDVRRVASWLSVVREVRDVEPPRRYTALLEDRIGPFALRADLEVTVDADDARGLHVAASGEDRQVASRIAATVNLALNADGAGTSLSVTGRYEVTGRVATLGAGAIRRKGDHLLEEFFANAAKELGAGAPSSP